MRIIYALFRRIEDAKEAVDRLLEQEFSEDQMNAVVQEDTAKIYLDIRKHQIATEKTSKIGNREVRGLESMLGGMHAITVSDVGPVFASGNVATTLIKAAAALNNGALKAALMDFQIPPGLASEYQRGILEGGLLFWIRTDQQSAYNAIAILEQCQATNLVSLPL